MDQLKNPVVVNAIVASLAESGVLVKTKIVRFFFWFWFVLALKRNRLKTPTSV